METKAPETSRKGNDVTETRFEECIHAMNNGNRDGLKEVYEEYVAYIYGIVRKLVPGREEAEDITSDFFIRLWEKSDTYRPGNGHKGWMASIARNMTIDHIRRYRREELVDFSAPKDVEGDYVQAAGIAAKAASSNPGTEEQVISAVSMQEALGLLKETERRIIHMKIMGELTFQEIADILKEPLGTVAWRYREAVKKLRRCGYEESGRGI